MSSSWPPQLKAWVQECLSKATASNKAAVNSELKQILFKAHADGTINTKDWPSVQLDSLKAQTLRTTHIPAPPPPSRAPPAIIPPPTTVHSTYNPYLPLQSVTSTDDGGIGGKKKKRKKTEAKSFPSAYTFSTPDDSAALARRAARFQQSSAASSSSAHVAPTGVGQWFDQGEGEGEGEAVGLGMLPGTGAGRKKLKGKGGLGYAGGEIMEVDPNVMDWDHYTIRGTSTKLEKSYLRLTSEPSPADIRPLPVLKQTLQLLKAKWKENHNYAYALDQFKSMRQDLTVQRIKNEFTVEVYEIHARIALEAKDLGEYNQCQTMLRQLYELGINGHPQEFMSYRIIYLLHTRNRSDMAALLAQLTSAEKADHGISHALQVHAALATSNYVRFFRLFNAAPNMSGYIMDHFVERERMAALAVMSKAYMTLPLPHLTQTLSFDSDSDTDSFLDAHAAAVYANSPSPAPQDTRSASAWRPIKVAPPVPLAERVWDCRKVHAVIQKGMEKYRVVDLKGQVD